MSVINLVLAFVIPYGFAVMTLYFLIKAAVKAALKAAHEDKMLRINGTRRQKENDETDTSDVIKLRDLGILSDDELGEAAEMYQKAKERERDQTAFYKSEKVLSELKEIGYLNDEQYRDKINALEKQYYIE